MKVALTSVVGKRKTLYYYNINSLNCNLDTIFLKLVKLSKESVLLDGNVRSNKCVNHKFCRTKA